MKTLLAVALLISSQIVKADALDEEIYSLSKRISENIHTSSVRLTTVEKKKMIKSLNEVSYNLEKIGCVKDADNYQQTLALINKFAAGALKLKGEEAREYALEWTRNYPCSYSERFLEDFFRVRGSAFNRLILNLDEKTATAYALKYSQNLCEDYELEAEFDKSFKFADSERGLNMNVVDAKAYARRHIEKHAFNCRNY